MDYQQSFMFNEVRPVRLTPFCISLRNLSAELFRLLCMLCEGYLFVNGLHACLQPQAEDAAAAEDCEDD